MTASDVLSVSTNLAIRGSLIEESYAFLESWDPSMPVSENLARAVKSTGDGGHTESWRAKLHAELRRRFAPEGRDKSLAILAAGGCPLDLWRPILLWHVSRGDTLLRDFLTTWLFNQHRSGVVAVSASDVCPYLAALPHRGLLAQPWSATTLAKVASQLLHVSADFGLLRGKTRRQFASYHLPDESFLYLLHAIVDLQPNARDVVHSTDWHVFLMDADDVERELFRLHQFRRLQYEVAGSLAQLNLPCASAVEYAREMLA